MFARAFALLSLALFVSASHIKARTSSQCPTGPAQCCTPSTASEAAKTTTDQEVLAMLNLIADPDTPVGINCSSSGLVNVGGGCTANQEPVCCDDNSFGTISIGCSPIGVNL